MSPSAVFRAVIDATTRATPEHATTSVHVLRPLEPLMPVESLPLSGRTVSSEVMHLILWVEGKV